MKRTKNILVACSIVLTGLACSNKEDSQGELALADVRKTALPEYQTLQVDVGEIMNEISITGRVIAFQKIDVVSEVQGISLPLATAFEEGTAYKKGQRMVAVDSEKFKNTLYAQKSRFMSAIVRIMSDLKLDYPDEYPVWDRYLSSLRVEEPLPSLPKVNSDQLKFFLSANTIYDLYYTIKSQEETLADYTLHAPFTGTLIMADVDPGDLVRPGVKLGELIRTDLYEVIAAVSVDELQFIKIGDEIDLKNQPIDKSFKATINRVGKRVDPSTQAVPVYLRVAGNDLKEGMYLEGSFKAQVFQNVTEIPKEVLTRENQVYLIADNVVQLTSVDPMAFLDETVIVTGLKTGDQVIAELVTTPIEGTKAISR